MSRLIVIDLGDGTWAPVENCRVVAIPEGIEGDAVEAYLKANEFPDNTAFELLAHDHLAVDEHYYGDVLFPLSDEPVELPHFKE